MKHTFISGEPEHNISVLDLKSLRELQDRAARLLGDTEGSLLPEQSREAVELLAELLMHTDQVIQTIFISHSYLFHNYSFGHNSLVF